KKFDERVFAAMKKTADYIEHFDLEREENAKIFNREEEEVPGKPGDYKFSLSDTSNDQTSGMSWQRLKFKYEMLDRQRRINPPALEERIPQPQVLATYLRQQLEDLGIRLGYNYGILDAESKSFVIINDKYSVTLGEDIKASVQDLSRSLGTSNYHVVLFPSDPNGSPGKLMVHFPHKRSWLWESVW